MSWVSADAADETSNHDIGGDLIPALVEMEHEGIRVDKNALAEFAVRGEGTETSMVAGELYRRGGQWKFRAVGQGFTDGLAGFGRHGNTDRNAKKRVDDK